MKVRDAMNRHTVSATPETTIRQVAGLMQENNVGSVMVVEGGKLKGIITDRDIVTRCIADGKNAADCRAADVMSGGGFMSTLTHADPDMDVIEAARLMGQHHVRRLPVMEQDRVIGVLSIADLAKDLRPYIDGVLEELSEQ